MFISTKKGWGVYFSKVYVEKSLSKFYNYELNYTFQMCCLASNHNWQC
jgi:hypothetical protein